jgi:predicted MFS family arabinose efflux permease
MKSKSPEKLLWLMSFAAAFGFACWHTLINNFAIEQAGFSGIEMGFLQSLREVPGFLAFTTVFLLLIFREQTFALLSIAILGIGVALTGFFPSNLGLYVTTVIMSVGFHYYYTVQKSLALQWIDKERVPVVLGHLSAARSYASIAVFLGIWLAIEWLAIDYVYIYAITGIGAIVLVLWAWRYFPSFTHAIPQHKKLILRPAYSLYYALVFMSGARRQIFIVFASFLMVEKFGFSAADIALLFLVNHIINSWAAPRIGKLIAKWGEHKALTLEYLGLIVIFICYALVDNAAMAATLFIIDHILFSLAISIESYFKRIADPQDIASTAGVSFTINHIAAVIIPAAFGFIWIDSPAIVFYIGAGMAFISLLLAQCIPGSLNQLEALSRG